MKQPKITTALHRIGMKETYKPPVGFSADPAEVMNSEGNEKYFSYDGGWKNGKMHGWGVYLYDDGGSYQGDFANNWPHGEGTSKYMSYIVDKLAHKHPPEHVEVLKEVSSE